MMLSVSIPDGMCSNEMPSLSRTDRTLRVKPTSEFIMSFSIVIEEKPGFPAIPVMTFFPAPSAEATIIVPGSSGLLVFLILIGMPIRRTGKIASSCSTVAPMYESSRSSL